MKTWTAIGAIFSIIGVVILIAGLAHGLAVVNALNQTGLGQYVGSQLEGTLFWSAFESYLIGSIILFVIGGVGFYAGGSASKINVEAPSSTITSTVETPPQTKTNNVEMFPQTFELNEPSTAVSGKSKILCGNCGAINDMDAVYCKKCGKQLR